jgi:hypothetical protein
LKKPSLSLLYPNNRSQFWRLVDDLCTKAPQAAELLGTKIIESTRYSSCPEDTIERPAAQSAAPDYIIVQSQKYKLEDCIYRPPKHTKTKIEHTDACYPLVENRAIYQSTYLAGRKLSKVGGITDNKALPGSAKLTSASTKKAEYNDSRLTSPTVQSNYLQSEGIKTNQSTKQIALVKLLLNLQEPVLPNSATQLELPESLKPDIPELSMPTQTKTSIIVSLQTEEIQRRKIPTSFETTCLLSWFGA